MGLECGHSNPRSRVPELDRRQRRPKSVEAVRVLCDCGRIYRTGFDTPLKAPFHAFIGSNIHLERFLELAEFLEFPQISIQHPRNIREEIDRHTRLSRKTSPLPSGPNPADGTKASVDRLS